jgi:hypothetical protein
MKKLSIGLLVSFLLYIFIYYIFISKSKSDQESIAEVESVKKEVSTYHVLSKQAEIDAFEAGSNSFLTLINKAAFDIYVKVMKSSDNSEYLVFILTKDQKEEVNILPGEFYLKLRYIDGKGITYQEMDPFNVGNNTETTITIMDDKPGKFRIEIPKINPPKFSK